MKKQNKLIIGSILALIAVVFVVLNTAPVAINFGFFKVKLPLIIVLVVMVIIGMLIAEIFSSDRAEKRKSFNSVLNKNKKKAE